MVLDYILNKAQKPEIEVLQKAILRRIKDLNSGIFGYRISDLARRMSDSVKEQLINCFSRETRRLLSDFLSGGISEEQFWKRYEQIKS